MKIKASLDVNAMKGFFVHHAEKIIFGLSALVLLGLAYGAVMQREGLSFTAQDLAEDARRAWDYVQKPHDKPPVEAGDFKAVADRIVQQIPLQPYQQRNPWDPAIFRPKTPRPRPPLLAVKDVRVSAGHGATRPTTMRVGAGPGMRNTEALRWVVLTGLIDYAKQKQAYLDAFQNAMKPPDQGRTVGAAKAAVDTPQYAYFYVERAEVTDTADPDRLKWVQLRTDDAVKAERRYAQVTRDLVSEKYVMRNRFAPFAFPLRKLEGQEWGPEVAHEPEIPMLRPQVYGRYGQPGVMGEGPMPMEPGAGGGPGAEAAPRGPMEPGTGVAPGAEGQPPPGEPPAEGQAPAAGEGAAAPDQPSVDAPPVPGAEGPGEGMFGPGEGPMGPMEPGMEGMGPGMEGMGPGMEGMGPGMEGPPGPMVEGPTGPMVEGPGGPMMEGPGGPMMEGMSGAYGQLDTPVKLFRFVDYSVQPGKKYRYRVRLMLRNPNYKVPGQYLESEKLATDPFIETDPSAASDVVQVPADAQVLAGAVRPGRIPSTEPSATVGVSLFSPQDGRERFQEIPGVGRGQMLNFTAADLRTLPGARTKASEQSTAGVSPIPMMEGPMLEGPVPADVRGPGRGPTRPPIPGIGVQEEEPELDYVTNTLLLDIRGGRALRGGDSEPGSLLLMDPWGNLVVRSETDDAADYRRFTEVDLQKGPYGYPGYPGYMPGMMGPGMEGMGPLGMPGEVGGPGAKKPGKTTKKPGKTPGYPPGMGPMMEGGYPGTRPPAKRPRTGPGRY